MNEEVLKNKITKYLTSILENKNINYVELEKRLKEQGINENQKNLSKKINKGTFSFLFLAQVLKVIDENTIEFDIEKDNISFKENELLTEEQFIKEFREINEIFVNDTKYALNDFIHTKYDELLEILYKKIGLTKKHIIEIQNCDYLTPMDKDLTDENIKAHYQELKKELSSFNKLEELKKKLLNK